MRVRLISGISHRFPWLSQSEGQVAHVLLTRSPLIRPASWPSPFDLHVLSTPPAFVLSQNQTLRKCQLAPHHQSSQATDKRNGQPLHTQADQSDSAEFGIRPPRRWRNDTNLNQDPPPSAPPPIGQKHLSRRAIWHRLFGTLLSSQGTDAHLLRDLSTRPRGFVVLNPTWLFGRPPPPSAGSSCGPGARPS